MAAVRRSAELADVEWRRMGQLKVLDPGVRALGPSDFVRLLGDDTQAEVLHHRHDIGYRDRGPATVQGQVQLRVGFPGGAVQSQAHGVGLAAPGPPSSAISPSAAVGATCSV